MLNLLLTEFSSLSRLLLYIEPGLSYITATSALPILKLLLPLLYSDLPPSFFSGTPAVVLALVSHAALIAWSDLF